MRMAVVGHVEWIEFVRVEAVPRPGEIIGSHETWEEPAGGGGVAAVELARLAGESSLFCVLGGDALGARSREGLEAASVRVLAPAGEQPQRRGFCFVDETGERTIVVIGEKARPRGGEGMLPWEELADVDGVYFTAGDAEAVRQARRARVLVATARELPTLQAAGVELDALVSSGDDEAERYQAGDLDPAPRLVVSTAGPLGGWAQPGGPFRAAEVDGTFEDAYGAGDCFAAGLTFALARGLDVTDALAFASGRGALALTRRGAGLSGQTG
jgi:ribokinase